MQTRVAVFLSLVIATFGLLVLGCGLVLAPYVRDPSRAFHVYVTGPTPSPTNIPAPTPGPTPIPFTDYRAVAILSAVEDTTTGDSRGTANPSPFDGNENYDWVTEQIFHPANRVPGHINSLALPDCADPGQPNSRYLYTESMNHGNPTSLMIGGLGINQIAVWPRVTEMYGQGRPTPAPTPIPPATPIPTLGPDYIVLASTWQQLCSVLGGRTITVRP